MIHENRVMPPLQQPGWRGVPMNLLRVMTILANRRRAK